MSIVYCEFCEEYINTDCHVEHFYDEDHNWNEKNCIRRQEDGCDASEIDIT